MGEQKIRRYNDGILFVSDEEIDLILEQRAQELSKQGFRSYVLKHPDGKLVDSMQRFFETALNSLPTTQTVHYSYWDALSDVLWQGFEELVDIGFVDIVWNDDDLVAENSLPTLIHGLLFLEHTLKGVRKEFGARHNLMFRLLLTSKSKNSFKDWFIER